MCRLSVEAYHGYVRVGEWSRGDIRSEGLFVSAVFEPGTELENYVDLLILLSFFLSLSGWHMLPSHANAQPQGRD